MSLQHKGDCGLSLKPRRSCSIIAMDRSNAMDRFDESLIWRTLVAALAARVISPIPAASMALGFSLRNSFQRIRSVGGRFTKRATMETIASVENAMLGMACAKASACRLLRRAREPV